MTDGGDSFSITAPAADAPATALVFASPHSGDLYPDDMGAAPGLSRARRALDDRIDNLEV